MFISLRRRGCSLANLSPFRVKRQGRPCECVCTSAKDVRRSLSQVDLKYVLIRFKVLINDLTRATCDRQCAEHQQQYPYVWVVGTDLSRAVVLAMVKCGAGFAMLLHLLLPLYFPTDHLMGHTLWGCEIFFICTSTSLARWLFTSGSGRVTNAEGT